jgi:hypothetical protein
LFNKIFIENSKAKGYKFLHIGSVQVAVKPLTRLGINASVLLCLRDARILNFRISILGMIQSSLYAGPIHFNVFPNLSLSLDDVNMLKALTLNVLTSGYDMEEGNRPLLSLSYLLLIYENQSESPSYCQGFKWFYFVDSEFYSRY